MKRKQMRTHTLQCHMPGCCMPIQRGSLMCSRHWTQLPNVLRMQIRNAWNCGTPKRGYKARLQDALKFFMKEPAHG